jgi:hypothetical protein
MTIEEHIKHWIDSAEDDLAAAEDLLPKGITGACSLVI